MRPSLLDRVDLGAVRSAAAALPGPWATVVACLLAPGVVQHDPGDPDWPDRDRLVVADGQASAALAAGGRAADVEVRGGGALAVARGLAAASDLDGGIFRAWCLLGEAALGDGATWEAAVDAAGTGAGSLAVVALAPGAAAGRLRSLFDLAAWRVCEARADDLLEVLGGLDRALGPAAGGAARPAALVARAEMP